MANATQPFFELMVHEYLVKTGHEIIEYEPCVNGRHPDFLVRSPEGEEFIVECACIRDDRIPLHHVLWRYEVMDCLRMRLQDEKGGQIIWVKDSMNFSTSTPEYCIKDPHPSPRKTSARIFREILAMIELGLRQKAVYIESPSTGKIVCRFDIEIEPTISLPHDAPPFLREAWQTHSRYDDPERIRKKISKKAKREQIKFPGKPAVLALSLSRDFSPKVGQLAPDPVLEALFGTHVIRVLRSVHGGNQLERDIVPDGHWWKNGKPSGYRTTAILAFYDLHPFTIVNPGSNPPHARQWMHPDPAHPAALSGMHLPRVQATPTAEGLELKLEHPSRPHDLTKLLAP